MPDRKTINDLIQKYDIPQATIADVCDRDRSEVSRFEKGIHISPAAESPIADAVRKIAKLCEKYQNIPLDLSDAGTIKVMIEDEERAAVYSVVLPGGTGKVLRSPKGGPYSGDSIFPGSREVS